MKSHHVEYLLTGLGRGNDDEVTPAYGCLKHFVHRRLTVQLAPIVW